ncbi:MAG: NAD(+)/NADH kinase [Candidatus Aquicultor sp.]
MHETPQKKMNTVTVVINCEKPAVPPIAFELIEWLGERGVKAIMHQDDAVKLKRPDLAADDAAIQSSDGVVCLGGDGTILRAVRILKGAMVPVVGVNLGRVGFLSEVEFTDMYPAMERVIAGDYKIDERMTLQCTVNAADFHQTYIALNEITVERGHHQRMLEMGVFINEQIFSRYKADGLIFATPTGSTAYSFSAGGPVVSPVHDLILLTPINPHSLFGRTVVLGSQDKIMVELGRRLEITVGIDGLAVFQSIADSVHIEKAQSKVLLIKLKDRSFYTVFKDKLTVWDTWLH